jgi:hypothetical protein
VVQGRSHVGEHRRVTVGDAGDEHPDAQTPRRLRERGRCDPPFEARTRAIAEDRLEVIERPTRLEHLDVVGGLPHGQHVGEGGVLR